MINMKTRDFILLSSVIVLSTISCQKELEDVKSSEGKLSYMEFSTVTTKTVLDASHNVLWKSTDHIGVFSSGQIYDFSTSQSGEKVTFTGNVEPTDTYFAVYPYESSATIDGETITTVLPFNQIAVKDGFADGANVTVAKTSGTTLNFKNVAGLIQFEITRSDISSVTFQARNGQKAAGKVAISVSDTPTWSAPEGVSEITLAAFEGALEPGVYYMVVLPQTYDGFALTLTNMDGNTFTRTVDAAINIPRADGVNLQKIDENATFAAAEKVYEIDLSTVDFSASYIYEAKDESGNIVAIICKEFLKDANQQAVVVYGTKKGSSSMVMDSADPVGLVAKVLKTGTAGQYETYADVADSDLVHGGTYSFKSDVMKYTVSGSQAALDKVYATYDSDTETTSVSGNSNVTPLKSTISARTLTLSDRGDTKAYQLVKIGRQIWMRENLITTKYKDGTDIPKAAKAAELQKAAADMYVYVNSACLTYNGDAVLTGKLAPSGGWKVPTKTDATTMLEYGGKKSHTLNYASNDVTGFSSRYAGRVTSKWDNSLDPCYWCSNAKDADNKMQCYVLRTAGTAPTTSGQSYKYGFWVRFMRGLY